MLGVGFGIFFIIVKVWYFESIVIVINIIKVISEEMVNIKNMIIFFGGKIF